MRSGSGLCQASEVLILRSPASPGVSKDEEPHRLRRMVRDGALRLLTMRFCKLRPLGSAVLIPSKAEML
ncbi:hypothetical protein DY467_17495 [Rhodopseudomonas sp. BR0G17]|nr:hypothetical protein [Rhodopseudomonas sp. BR0G17]